MKYIKYIKRLNRLTSRYEKGRLIDMDFYEQFHTILVEADKDNEYRFDDTEVPGLITINELRDFYTDGDNDEMKKLLKKYRRDLIIDKLLK